MAGSWLIASVLQRLDDGDVVDDRRRVRQQFADPGAALAVLVELEHRRDAGERLLARGHAGDPLAHADRRGQLLCRDASASFGL